MLRTWFNREWGILHQIIAGHTAPVTLTKVSAHTGNLGNEIADCVAKHGAARGDKWEASFHAVPDIQFYPVHGDGLPIEGDLYTYLRLQSQLQIAVTWQYQK